MPADYSIPQLQNINPSVSTPAGRLVHFLPNWKKLTSDRLVWQIVEGYRIPLKCVPHQWRPRLTKGSSIGQTRLLKTAIHELQEKGAVKEVNRVDDQYLSILFILKQGEKNRPVFNLR